MELNHRRILRNTVIVSFHSTWINMDDSRWDSVKDIAKKMSVLPSTHLRLVGTTLPLEAQTRTLISMSET